MSEIINYIDSMILMLGSNANSQQLKYYEFLKEKGSLYNQASFILQPAEFDVQVKQCFRNSLMACLYHDLDYVEGFYYKKQLFPMEHAWNTLKDDLIVQDYTTNEFNIKTDERYGIKIPVEIIHDYVKQDTFHYTALHYCFLKINNLWKH